MPLDHDTEMEFLDTLPEHAQAKIDSIRHADELHWAAHTAHFTNRAALYERI